MEEQAIGLTQANQTEQAAIVILDPIYDELWVPVLCSVAPLYHAYHIPSMMKPGSKTKADLVTSSIDFL